MNFIYQIESDFAIKYPESVMSMFKNFEQFMSGVKKHLSKKSGPSSFGLILQVLENPHISGIFTVTSIFFFLALLIA